MPRVIYVTKIQRIDVCLSSICRIYIHGIVESSYHDHSYPVDFHNMLCIASHSVFPYHTKTIEEEEEAKQVRVGENPSEKFDLHCKMRMPVTHVACEIVAICFGLVCESFHENSFH